MTRTILEFLALLLCAATLWAWAFILEAVL